MNFVFVFRFQCACACSGAKNAYTTFWWSLLTTATCWCICCCCATFYGKRRKNTSMHIFLYIDRIARLSLTKRTRVYIHRKSTCSEFNSTKSYWICMRQVYSLNWNSLARSQQKKQQNCVYESQNARSIHSLNVCIDCEIVRSFYYFSTFSLLEFKILYIDSWCAAHKHTHTHTNANANTNKCAHIHCMKLLWPTRHKMWIHIRLFHFWFSFLKCCDDDDNERRPLNRMWCMKIYFMYFSYWICAQWPKRPKKSALCLNRL